MILFPFESNDNDLQFVMELIGVLYPKMHSIALRELRHDEDAAGDCIENVIDIARKKANIIREHPNPAGWIYNTLHKCIKREQVKKGKQPVFLGLDMLTDKIPHEYTPQEDDIIDDEMIEKTKATILEGLTSKEKSCYDMFYVQHLPKKEIANQLGISESAVAMRLFRLSKKIKLKVNGMFE